MIFRSGVQEIVWTKPIKEDVDDALSSLLYGLIREESSIFYRTDEIRLNKGRIFLNTGKAQKTFLLTYGGRSIRLPKCINKYLNMFVIQDMVYAALASGTDKTSRSLSYRLIFISEQSKRCTGAVHPGRFVRCEKIPPRQCGENRKGICGRR